VLAQDDAVLAMLRLTQIIEQRNEGAYELSCGTMFLQGEALLSEDAVLGDNVHVVDDNGERSILGLEEAKQLLESFTGN
jgi:hypothetical protein